MLAGDVGEVGSFGGFGGESGADAGAGDEESGEHGVGSAFLAGFLVGDGFVGEDGDQLAEGADAEDGDAGDERGLAGGLFGDDDLAVSGFGGGEDGGQDAADGADASVEAEFADEDEVGDGAGVDPFGGAEDGGCDGEVESAAAFGDGGGAEADGQFLLGPFGAGVDDGGADPVAALAEALVGEADEGEGRDAGFEVCLDLDDDAFDADEGDGAGAGESHQATPWAWVRTGAPLCGRTMPMRSMRTPPAGAGVSLRSSQQAARRRSRSALRGVTAAIGCS
ncbi:hypothetical protein EDD98_3678 [Streptomyces sp. PanSC19]|nr:hypothetical protein EDD98_3678 [Streptomyces sp. PanSC19]